MAVDTKRNRLLWCQPSAPRTIDLSGYSVSLQTLSGNGALISEFTALGAEGLGLIYDPRTDAYYVRARAAGSTVYKIDAGTFTITTVPVVGSVFPPVSGGSSSPGGHGIYNKWILLPHLRGIAYLPDSGSNIWFMRLY